MGSLSEPLPLVKDGDLVSILLHMLNARRPDTVRVTRLKGKLLRLMLILVGSGWRIGMVTWRLMLLLAWLG